jgi:hypothetical protein
MFCLCFSNVPQVFEHVHTLVMFLEVRVRPRVVLYDPLGRELRNFDQLAHHVAKQRAPRLCRRRIVSLSVWAMPAHELFIPFFRDPVSVVGVKSRNSANLDCQER